MKLYKLTPAEELLEIDNPWSPWYDKAFGFIIRAETPERARQIAHENAGEENKGEFAGRPRANTQTPWLDEKYSTCRELEKMGEEGLIIRDFASA